MSETCTWLCGMYLAFEAKNPALFRENEQKLIDCYHYYQK